MMRIKTFFKLAVAILLVHPWTADLVAQRGGKMRIQVISKGGSIVNKDNNRPLRRGNTFNNGDPLSLAPRQTKMRVINDRNQSYYVYYSSNYPGYQLRPTRTPRGTRDGNCLNALTISSYFVDSLNVLDQTLEIPICSSGFLMDEGHFFYLRMQHEGKAVNKKLAYRSDTLIIEYADIYHLEGEILSVDKVDDLYLMYRDQERKKTITVTPLQLSFLPNDELVEEVEFLLESMSEVDSNTEKRQEIESFIFNFYGRFDEADFVQWLADHFTDVGVP